MRVVLERAQMIGFSVAIAWVLAAPIPSAVASEWLDQELQISKELGDWATTFAKTSNKVSPITKALATAADKLKKSIALDTITDKTMISFEDLERLDAERQTMDKVMPPTLETMNSKEAYKEIVGNIETPATYQSGLEELNKLDEAEKQRGRTIGRLEENREKLQKIAQSYQQDAEVGARISERLNKLVEEHPELDTFFVLTGMGHLSLTALGYETEFLPALIDRASSAEEAVKRYDTAIKAAKDDLKRFNDLKSYFRRIYRVDPGAVDPLKLNPRAIDINPGVAGNKLEEARQATAKTHEIAAALQAEADRINAHNAKISRIQGFIGLARASIELGRAVNEVPSSTGTNTTSPTNTNTYNYKMETKIIIIQAPSSAEQPVELGPQD